MNTCFLISLINDSGVSPSVTTFINDKSFLNICIDKIRKCNFTNTVLLTNCKHSQLIAAEQSTECTKITETSMDKIMYNSAIDYMYEYGFFMNSNFPLIENDSVMKYLKKIQLGEFDSGFSSNSHKELPLWKNGQPINFSLAERNSFSQQECSLENGAFYIRTRNSILSGKNLYSGVIKNLDITFQESINHQNYLSDIKKIKKQPIIENDFQKILKKTSWLKK